MQLCTNLPRNASRQQINSIREVSFTRLPPPQLFDLPLRHIAQANTQIKRKRVQQNVLKTSRKRGAALHSSHLAYHIPSRPTWGLPFIGKFLYFDFDLSIIGLSPLSLVFLHSIIQVLGEGDL